jgi:hypothetical protein
MKDMFVKIWDNFSLFLKSRDPCMSSYYSEFIGLNEWIIWECNEFINLVNKD